MFYLRDNSMTLLFGLLRFFTLVNVNQEAASIIIGVVGLGILLLGIFFKCKNPDKVKEWYSKHPGFIIDTYGTSFEWRQAYDGSKKGFTAWSTFKEDTKYFDPLKKSL